MGVGSGRGFFSPICYFRYMYFVWKNAFGALFMEEYWATSHWYVCICSVREKKTVPSGMPGSRTLAITETEIPPCPPGNWSTVDCCCVGEMSCGRATVIIVIRGDSCMNECHTTRPLRIHRLAFWLLWPSRWPRWPTYSNLTSIIDDVH